jgi:hypothetical protein
MTVSNFMSYLKVQFPGIKFYNGTINAKDDQCIGVYLGTGGIPHVSIGGMENSSFAMLPIRILVHWTKNSDACEQMARRLYNRLIGLSSTVMGTIKVKAVTMLDPCPVGIGHDENGICEVVIRLQIIYERG